MITKQRIKDKIINGYPSARNTMQIYFLVELKIDKRMSSNYIGVLALVLTIELVLFMVYEKPTSSTQRGFPRVVPPSTTLNLLVGRFSGISGNSLYSSSDLK